MSIYTPQSPSEALRNTVGSAGLPRSLAIRLESTLGNELALDQAGIRFESSSGVLRVQQGEIVNTVSGQAVRRQFAVSDIFNGSTTVTATQIDTGAGTVGGNTDVLTVPAPTTTQPTPSQPAGVIDPYLNQEGLNQEQLDQAFQNQQPVVESAPPPVFENPVDYYVPLPAEYIEPEVGQVYYPTYTPEPWYYPEPEPDYGAVFLDGTTAW